MKSFDRATVRETRSRLQAALDTVAKELGCQIQVGNASFSGPNCTFKVECAVVGKDGTAQTQETTDFKALATRYGLSPDDLGKVFTTGGHEYRVAGLKPKSHRYPIVAVRVKDDKTYKFPADVVKLALGAAAGA